MPTQRPSASREFRSRAARRSDATSSNRRENQNNSNNSNSIEGSDDSGLQRHASALLPSYDFSVGADKLHLRWPLSEAAYDLDNFDAYMQGRLLDPEDKFSPYIHIKPQYGYERLDAFLDGPRELTRDAAYAVTVQFNPARSASIGNGGDGLCPFDMLQPVARAGFEKLQGLLPAACSWQECIVARIDLARDFAVEDPAAWLEKGRGIRHQYAQKQPMYIGRDGANQTLVSGVKGQRCQLYDKPAERKDKKKPCSDWTRLHNLRFEAQLTGKKTVTSGLGTLERLTPQYLNKALRKVWADSRVGDYRMSPSPGQLIAASRLTASDKLTLLGYVAGRQDRLGLDGSLAREERTRLRGLAAELGIMVRGNAVTIQVEALMLDLSLGRAATTGSGAC